MGCVSDALLAGKDGGLEPRWPVMAVARDERGATPVGEHRSTHTPVTYDSCVDIGGPFYHGTKSALEVGAELVAGYGFNFNPGPGVQQHLLHHARGDSRLGGGAGHRAGR